jgi:hypothetical protein
MKKLATLLAVVAVAGFWASANALEYGDVGLGSGYIGSGPDRECTGVLFENYDGTFENGYCWQYDGIQAPYYGAFAECYFGGDGVSCGRYVLTQVGNQIDQTMDCYVWNDGGGIPGDVACVVTGVDPGPVAFWPSLSIHDIELVCCDHTEAFWVGCWGNWPGNPCAWFTGADLDGFGGCPYTNVAPGIGFPTGWQHVEVIWGPTQAMGIGCWLDPNVSATETATWGSIKALFN